MEGALGSSLPFLLLEDGEVSYLALAWARHKMLDAEVGTASLSKAVAAVGRFYDYYMVERQGSALAANELRLLLKQFFEARRFGADALGWEPVKAGTAADDVRAVSEFTEWCSENFGHVAVNPRERVMLAHLNLAEQMTLALSATLRKKWDFLYHLAPARAEANGAVTMRPFAPGKGRSKRTTGLQKHYPPEKAWATIASTPRTRDKLYLLLLFFGGVRISEPLHLFASDVSVQADGTARVVFGHPQDGAYLWIGRDGKRQRGRRATFLAERYGFGPRNLLGETHPLHAGWKGMMQDDPSRSESVVHWLRDDASRLFARLHAEYMRTVRSRIPDMHPYYFVNERADESYGGPLKHSNVSKGFTRAAVRVGLSAADDGVNPHGARHFYGYYCASVLRLPVETTQRLMHHESIQSTELYYALSGEAVRTELLRAQARQALEAPELLAAPFSLLPAPSNA